MAKYALQFYYLSGANKGNRFHREEFSSMIDCINRYNDVFDYGLFNLNPTIRTADTDQYILYDDALVIAEQEKTELLEGVDDYLCACIAPLEEYMSDEFNKHLSRDELCAIGNGGTVGVAYTTLPLDDDYSYEYGLQASIDFARHELVLEINYQHEKRIPIEGKLSDYIDCMSFDDYIYEAQSFLNSLYAEE